ncbi:MAG: hypothetical protein ACU843_19405 [Gammaproteobacteria bacterium]
MKRIEPKKMGSAVLLDFSKFRVRQTAREYVRYYFKYGAECASVWSIDAVAKSDKNLFKEYVRREMKKYGIKS